MAENLFGKTLDELIQLSIDNNLPKYTGKQLADWLYKKQVNSIENMTNLSKKAREILTSKFSVGIATPNKVQESEDGTKKYLFPTSSHSFIETAMIPEKDRLTVCVSSQVGCKMGCLFCMTAKQGFQGQLTAGEIVNQVVSIKESQEVTNIVYMGMGEPFDNLPEVLKSVEILTSDWGFGMSPKRITVSSIGIIPGMLTFFEKSSAHLAISLHNPFDHERQQLMPVQVAYPISDVIDEIKKWQSESEGKQRRVSFEYIMLKGVNDTSRHVKELARLLNGIRCRLNLIRFHPIPGTPLLGSDDATIFEFKDMLNKKGIFTTIRASRGQDIYAACGLLSTKELIKNPHYK